MLETFLAILILIDVYTIVFYRLMIKHYYEKDNNLKESSFGAIFSFPPYSKLSMKGKQYSRKYWVAIIILLICIALLIPGRDFTALQNALHTTRG